jgi:peptidase M48-like protein
LDLPFVGYARAFLRYSSRVSRAQEVAADAVSARVAGREAAARALVAADARASAWQVYLFSEVLPMLEAGFLPELLSGFRHFEAAVQDNRERLKGLRKPPQKASQYDTHPSLEERLAALGVEQPPSSLHGGALDLLDVASEAEEYVLRNLLVDESRPLKRLAWQDAGRDLWLPRFRERIKPHQSALLKVVPEALPAVLERIDEWADGLRTGLALFSPEAKRRHVVALFGTWYAVHLADLGFELEALPGWPVRAVSEGCAVEPFLLVSALLEGKLDATSWLAHCANMRTAVA